MAFPLEVSGEAASSVFRKRGATSLRLEMMVEWLGSLQQRRRDLVRGRVRWNVVRSVGRTVPVKSV